jgi:hypothetical protein
MMSLTEFKRLNKAKGYYWFEPDTMRFFKTRISNWDPISGTFITSEKGPDGQRRFSVRKANFETGEVDTVGKFQQYGSLGAAKTARRTVVRGSR